MITIYYFKPIYIRINHNDNDVINDDSYVISVSEDECMVMYKDEIIIEIAKFKQLIDAIEYVKFLCDGLTCTSSHQI